MKTKPILKWAGGKKWLAPRIQEIIQQYYFFNDKESYYFEPFFGAGAVFFTLQPRKAIVNDLNQELMLLLEVIKNDCENLICELQNLKDNYVKSDSSKEYYYEVRSWDRDENFYQNLSDTKKIARLIFLNKTGFNGLFRVNSKGQFNVPIGGNNASNILDIQNIERVKRLLNDKNGKYEFLSGDFIDAVYTAKKGDVVYFDPPYDPIGGNSHFTQYTKEGFDQKDQIKLRDLAEKLVSKGVHVLISNNATEFIKDIYDLKNSDKFVFEAEYPLVARSINSDGKKRNKIREILIYSKFGDKKMNEKLLRYIDNEEIPPQANNLEDIYKITEKLFECPLAKSEINNIDKRLNDPRQFDYYSSAMVFLEISESAKYIGRNVILMTKEFYEYIGKSNEFSKKKFANYVKNKLIEKKVYSKEDFEKYCKIIGYSESTIERRFSTINSWKEKIEEWLS